MRVFHNIQSITDLPETSVALGFFDGLHMGHRELIGRCVKDAKSNNRKSAVFTFREPPTNIMTGKPVIKRLLTPEGKIAGLEELGVDYVFDFDFRDGFRAMPPETFANDLIAKTFNAKSVYCGFNFRFGKNASGDSSALIDLGEQLGFSVHVLEPVWIAADGSTVKPASGAAERFPPAHAAAPDIVSSTLIRSRIAAGRVDAAEEMLMRPYTLSGTVTEGKKLGHVLGFPTANFPLNPAMACPAFGVYITRTLLDNASLPSVTNIGINPTTDENTQALVETHILNFDANIYGKKIDVEFLHMLRPEKKFGGLEELKNAIAQNKADAEAWFGD